MFIKRLTRAFALSLILTPALAVAEQSLAGCACEAVLHGHLEGEIPYVRRRCQSNVIQVLDYARKSLSNFDLKQAKVLILRNPTEESLQAYAVTGLNPKVQWHYHVVTEFGGHVIDQDYDGEPHAPDLAMYLRRMFRVSRSSGHDPEITVIPALDYLHEFGHISPSAQSVDGYYYLESHEGRRRYPHVSAQAILDGLPLPRPEPAPHPMTIPERPRLEVNPLRRYILWRENENIHRLDAALGTVATDEGEPIEADPVKRDRFLRTVEARAKFDARVNSIWAQFVENGGRQP